MMFIIELSILYIKIFYENGYASRNESGRALIIKNNLQDFYISIYEILLLRPRKDNEAARLYGAAACVRSAC